MPIYEFYCRDCHTIFNFRSPRIDTESRPACPRCRRPELERRVSRFAVSRGRADGADADAGAGEGGAGDDLPAGFDEARAMQAMEAMAGDLEGAEDDPRRGAQALRRLYQAMGLPHGPGLEEALARMEAGEDPESIEADLGDALESETLGGEPKEALRRARRAARAARPPAVDDTLYDL